MNKGTFGFVKKNLLVIMIMIMTIILISYIIFEDSKVIKEVKKSIENELEVLYISTENNYSKYIDDLLKKYDIKYLNINSDNLSKIEVTKLKKIIDYNDLSNIIVLYENGKIKDKLIRFADENNVLEFFQKNEIIPKIIGKIDGIFDDVEKNLKEDLSILYVPYEYIDGIENQNDILNEISSLYKINYQKIDAYLLSNFQKSKLNSILQISNVDDQIVIFIKNGKIVGSIRGIKNRDVYIESLETFGLINQNINLLNEINFDEFNEIIKEQYAQTILITKEDCKYCFKVINTLSNIISNNENLKIYMLNIENNNSELANLIKNNLSDLAYNDAFTVPITLIFKSNKVVDYIIGASTEEYFIEIFNKNGIIN